jgi:DNA-binding NarL/FixJ family response regulator
MLTLATRKLVAITKDKLGTSYWLSVISSRKILRYDRQDFASGGLPGFLSLRDFLESALGKCRILLADDHTLVAEAVKNLLEPEFDVVGVAADGQELLRLAEELRPEVILLDLNMPLLNGFEAGKQLKRTLPETKLIVLTMSEDPGLAAEAMGEWASGYLSKMSEGDELPKAIRTVLGGGQYVTPEIAKRLEEWFARELPTNGAPTLTPRQREVLRLLAEGRTMKEVAALLNVATRTVAFHKYKIMQEFGLENNSQLLRFAIRQKVVEPI